MAIPILESQSFNSGTATTSITLTKPTGVASGDLLLIIAGSDPDNTSGPHVNTPSGFTKIKDFGDAGTDAHIAAFYRIADGTEGATLSLTTVSATELYGHYIRYSGVDNISPLNVVSRDFDLEIVLTGVTTTADNCMAFYCLAHDGANGSPFSASGVGWIERGDVAVGSSSGGVSGCWGTKEMPTAGATGSVTISPSSTDGTAAFQFAIKGSEDTVSNNALAMCNF